MMEEKIKKQVLESSTYYNSICRIELHPIEEVTSSWHLPKHKKGDIKYTRSIFTGFRKKIKKIYTEDLWYDDYCGWLNIQKYAAKNDFLVIDGKLHRKASINIESNIKGGSKILKFNTDSEAFECMKGIKEKCKLCGNNLL